MHGCYLYGGLPWWTKTKGRVLKKWFLKVYWGYLKIPVDCFLKKFPCSHSRSSNTEMCFFHLKWVIRWRGSECLSWNALVSSSNSDLSRISQPCGLWDFVRKFAFCKHHVIYIYLHTLIFESLASIIGEQKHTVFPLWPPHQLSPMQTWRPILKRWKIADPQYYNLKHSGPTCLIEHRGCHSSVIDVSENIWHKLDHFLHASHVTPWVNMVNLGPVLWPMPFGHHSVARKLGKLWNPRNFHNERLVKHDAISTNIITSPPQENTGVFFCGIIKVDVFWPVFFSERGTSFLSP